jgi:hypothetical protein
MGTVLLPHLLELLAKFSSSLSIIKPFAGTKYFVSSATYDESKTAERS